MKSKMIQVRMRAITIDQADETVEKIGAPSRSDVIRRAVDLQYALVMAIEQGDKIMIHGKKGRQTQILIPGLLGEK